MLIKVYFIVSFVCLGYTLNAQYDFNTESLSKSVIDLTKSLSEQDKITFCKPYMAFDSISWSNLPLDDVHRITLPINRISDESKFIVNRILRDILSESGYLKYVLIRMYDDLTKEKLTKMNNPIAYKYGLDNYWIALYGNPAKNQPFAFQFEGHHFSISILVNSNTVKVSPLFIGINPATSRDGKYAGFSIMDNEKLWADKLFESLSDTQLSKAIIDTFPSDADVTIKNNSFLDRYTLNGLSLQLMDASQKEIVYKIINTWVSNLNANIARQMMNKYFSDDQNIHFFWKGNRNADDLHYFAIKGQDFIIENTNRDGGNEHLHSILYERR